MSDLRTEHARREAEGWAEFEQALDRVPLERWDESGVLDGWTAKGMLWHVAFWLDRCATKLDGRRDPAFADVVADDLSTDERNAEIAAEAQGMDPDAVWAGVLAARERVRRSWEQLPEIDQDAIEELAEETYEHYEEHLLDLAKFAG